MGVMHIAGRMKEQPNRGRTGWRRVGASPPPPPTLRCRYHAAFMNELLAISSRTAPRPCTALLAMAPGAQAAGVAVGGGGGGGSKWRGSRAAAAMPRCLTARSSEV